MFKVFAKSYTKHNKGGVELMEMNLSEREWRHIKIGLLELMTQSDKACKEIKFEDNPLIKELLKLHDKIDKECDRTK